MAGLNVANPDGFDTPHFLSLGAGGVAVSLGTLRKETVRLPLLAMADLDVNLERRVGKANYKVIMENLKRLESGDKPADQSGEGKRFIVDEIDIRNVTVNVDLLPVGGEATRVIVPIEEIKLADVGSDSDKGVLLTELSSVLVKAILTAAVQNGGGVIPADVLGDLQSQLAKLESLGDMGIELLAGAEGQLKEITGQLGEIEKSIGNLLGGEKEKDGEEGG
jgi:hypothetical protein